MPGLEYIKVTGRLGAILPDGSDPGDEPDVVYPASGLVKITSLIGKTPFPEGSPRQPYYAIMRPLVMAIGEDGYFRRGVDDYGTVLDVTSDQIYNPIGPGMDTHQVEFSGISIDGVEIALKPQRVRIAPDTIGAGDACDLSLLLPPGYLDPIGEGVSDAGMADVVATGAETRAALDSFVGSQSDVVAAVAAAQNASALVAGRFPQPNTRKLLGPGPSETVTVTQTTTADPYFTKVYTVSGTTIPADWPVETVGSTTVSGGYIYPSPIQNGRLHRVMSDAPKIGFRLQSAATPKDGLTLYVDGAPVSLDPYILTTTGGSYFILEFSGGARPRLIEFNHTGGIQMTFVAAPYRAWKPSPQQGLKGLMVGDSYTLGVVMNGSDTTQSPTIHGFSPHLGVEIGVENWATDGIGGSGILRRNSGQTDNYNDRRASHIASAPDVLVVGGGGANDRYHGISVADTINGFITYFTEVRAALPDTKLVMLEGFAPPNFVSTVPTIVADYIAIREGVQAALGEVGVYYIDIATSAAWIDGTGRVGATTGTGNSDIYIGGDGIHFTIAGAKYIKSRLAPKLRAAVADDGTLVNTLI